MRLFIILLCLCLVFTPIPPVEGQSDNPEVSLQCLTSGIFFYNETTVADGKPHEVSCTITNPTSHREKIEYMFTPETGPTSGDIYDMYLEPATSMSFNFTLITQFGLSESWPRVLNLRAYVTGVGENDSPPEYSASSEFEYIFHRSAFDFFSLDKNETQILTIDESSTLIDNQLQNPERFWTEPPEGSFWVSYSNFSIYTLFSWDPKFEFCEDFFESHQMRCHNWDVVGGFHLSSDTNSEAINTSSWTELPNGSYMLTLETSFDVFTIERNGGMGYCGQ